MWNPQMCFGVPRKRPPDTLHFREEDTIEDLRRFFSTAPISSRSRVSGSTASILTAERFGRAFGQ